MKKTVLTFGLMSGGVSAATMLATIPYADASGWQKGEILGYATIVLSALAIFGQAIAGKSTFRAAGLPGDAATEKRFRDWLAELLAEHLKDG